MYLEETDAQSPCYLLDASLFQSFQRGALFGTISAQIRGEQKQVGSEFMLLQSSSRGLILSGSIPNATNDVLPSHPLSQWQKEMELFLPSLLNDFGELGL